MHPGQKDTLHVAYKFLAKLLLVRKITVQYIFLNIALALHRQVFTLDENLKFLKSCLFLSAEGAECIQQKLYKGGQKGRWRVGCHRKLLAICSWVSLESMAAGAESFDVP